MSEAATSLDEELARALSMSDEHFARALEQHAQAQTQGQGQGQGQGHEFKDNDDDNNDDLSSVSSSSSSSSSSLSSLSSHIYQPLLNNDNDDNSIPLNNINGNNSSSNNSSSNNNSNNRANNNNRREPPQRPRRHRPSIIRGPNDVQLNALSSLRSSLSSSLSPRMFTIYMIASFIEIVFSIIVLSLSYNSTSNSNNNNNSDSSDGARCSQFSLLSYWLIVAEVRYVAMIPITCLQFLRGLPLAEQEQTPINKLKKWVEFFSFLWWLTGQIAVYTSSACAISNPLLYYACLTLLLLTYLMILFPLVLLVLVCMCLPFVLIAMRVLTPSRGASIDQITRLPQIVYQPSPAQEQEHGQEQGQAQESESMRTCSICMEDYAAGDILHSLPCHHRFHKTCGEQWLRINMTCPLCRAPIVPGSNNRDDDDIELGQLGQPVQLLNEA